MAVDDDADTYWASKFDDTNTPVEYVIDFGEVQKLSSMELSWEFPARSFAVAASVDGEHFTDVYATDANVVKSSRISLDGAAARRLRISMLEVRGLRVAPYFFLSPPLRSCLYLSSYCSYLFPSVPFFFPACASFRRSLRSMVCASRTCPVATVCKCAVRAHLVFVCSLIQRTDGGFSNETSACLDSPMVCFNFVKVPRPPHLWYSILGRVC